MRGEFLALKLPKLHRTRARSLCLLLTSILILSIATLIQFTFIHPVQASPALLNCYGQSHNILGMSGGELTDEAYAYDISNTTGYASFNYGKTTDSTNYFEVIDFYSTYTFTISQVDFKMRYYADANTNDETYAIEFQVGSSSVVTLKAASGDAHALATDVWAGQAEPNDGTWTWADIGDIKFRVSCSDKAGSAGNTYFHEYEAWVTVHITPNAYSLVYVEPASVVNTTATPQTTVTLRPDGDGSYTQWQDFFNASADWHDWDDTDPHDGDATYLHSEYDDNLTTSTLQDPTHSAYTIAAVRVHMVSRATDAGSNERLYAVVYSSGWSQEYWGVQVTPTTTYQETTTEWAMNPETDDFWTWDEIDNLEVGAYSEAYGAWPSGNELRVTQIYVEVLTPRLSVDIRVDYVEDLKNYEYVLTYNPDVIQGIHIDEGQRDAVTVGEFLGRAGGTVYSVQGRWNNTLGLLTKSGARVTGNRPTGGGTLSTAVFWVTHLGESDITLGEGTVLNNNTGPVTIQLQHGYFRNVATDQLPTTSFSIAPEDTPPTNGTIRGFNVNFTSTSSAAGAKTISTNKWYFWDIFHSRFTSFSSMVLRPDGNGGHAAWTNDYNNWKDVSPDHDTSFVSASTYGLNETSNLKDYTAESWPISKITVYAYARQTGENLSMRFMLVTGGNPYSGSLDQIPTSTYAPYTEEWTTNPATASAWAWSDINALQAGVRSLNDSVTFSGELRVTQLYIEVSTPPSTSVNTGSLLRNYFSKGEKNVTLTVIDSADVVGTKTGWVDIKSHDIFFTGISTNTTRAPEYPVINFTEIGNWVNITVTTVNQGSFTESFDVTVFWSTLVLAEYRRGIVGTQTGVTLAAGASIKLNFYWDTENHNITHPAGYTLSANASRIAYEWDIEWTITKVAPNEFRGDAVRVRHHDVAITDVKLHSYLRLTPNADGHDTQWDYNYDDWDDPSGHDGDGSYVNASAYNKYESSALTNHVSEAWTIYKVRVVIFAKLVASPESDDEVQLMLVNSTTGTRSISPDQYNPNNYTYSKFSSEWSQNPFTGKAWTWTNIDALEAGVKSTVEGFSWTGEMRVTQLYVEVLGPSNTTLSVLAGEIVNVEVTVLNEGDFNETGIVITAYHDSTSIIPTQTIHQLCNKSYSDEEFAYYGLPDNYTTTLEFLWDTTSASAGAHTIKAATSTITGDYDVNDNTCIDGTVTVTAAVPEFPFGAALEIALLAVIVFVWLKRRKPGTKPGKETFLRFWKKTLK